jgi:GNAT superfamily N-acetyltransferase
MATMIEPATADRFDDVQHALSGGGDGASCQCQWWMMRNRDWQQTTREQRTGVFRAEFDGTPSPGLVAYVDGEAAAWVRVGPRTAQQRLAHTREFAQKSVQPWDDSSVWGVTCFVVRREFRGRGLASQLLDAAIVAARDGGARVLEAYPVDTAMVAKRVNDLYTGVLSTFLKAGFREVAHTRAGRVIVELDLTAA